MARKKALTFEISKKIAQGSAAAMGLTAALGCFWWDDSDVMVNPAPPPHPCEEHGANCDPCEWPDPNVSCNPAPANNWWQPDVGSDAGAADMDAGHADMDAGDPLEQCIADPNCEPCAEPERYGIACNPVPDFGREPDAGSWDAGGYPDVTVNPMPDLGPADLGSSGDAGSSSDAGGGSI